jgi:ABC-type sugar transport system substrate-binding protein
MKKFLALVMALAMVLSLAACGSSSDTSSDTSAETPAAESVAAETPAAESSAAEETPAAESTAAEGDTDYADNECDADLDYTKYDLSGLNIGYVTINSQAPWGGLVGTSFAEYAQAQGATVTSLDAQTVVDQVTEYCEQFIEEGVDALVIFGGDIDANAEIAKEASEAGVAVFMAALDVAESGREYVSAVVGPDQQQAFADIAAYVVEDNGTDDDQLVVQINGVPFLEDYIERTAGFQGYMADYSNYDLSPAVFDAYSSRTDAKGAMEDFISSYGDQISILIGYDDDLTMGGVQAISEAGLTDSIKVYSFTGQKDAIQAVIDGQMELTVMNRATDIGAGLVSAIGEYFSTGSTTYYQRTPLTYITADNAADYLDKAEF